MTRYMVDSINVSAIPQSFENGLIGCYVDGRYSNYGAMKARFPNATLVPITTSYLTHAVNGIVIDKEKGDYTSYQTLQAVKAKRAIGIDPTVYCSDSDWNNVWNTFANNGERQPHYWIADYDGVAVIPNGAIAKQYWNNVKPSKSIVWYPGCDTSIVADYWPGIDPPIKKDKTKMFLRRDMTTGRIYLQTSDGHLYWIPDTSPDLVTLRAIHGNEVNLTSNFLKEFPGYQS